MLTFRPLNHKISVKPDQAATQSAGGILIPEDARKAPPKGIVLAVGPDVQCEVKPGDWIMYSKYGGAAIKIAADSPDIWLVEDTDVFGVLEEG